MLLLLLLWLLHRLVMGALLLTRGSLLQHGSRARDVDDGRGCGRDGWIGLLLYSLCMLLWIATDLGLWENKFKIHRRKKKNTHRSQHSTATTAGTDTRMIGRRRHGRLLLVHWLLRTHGNLLRHAPLERGNTS